MSAVLLVAAAASGAIAATTLADLHARRRVRARLARPTAPPVPARPRVAAPIAVSGAAGVAWAWVAVGPGPVIALLVAAASGPLLGRVRARSAARGLRHQQLPSALERMATALRSGTSLALALDEVGTALDPPLGPELAALAREAAQGRPLRDVITGWSAVHDDAGTRLAATALLIATVVGSAPGRALDGVAATLRERLDLAAERRALATQARASALVLSAAPVGFAVLLVLGDAAASEFLLGTPAGWVCLGLGGGLDVLGAWWMSRLTRSDAW
jgi:tight adherence protein B